MTAYFVTATGTGIGKTYVTAGLVRQLRAGGQEARALKPVISGIDGTNYRDSDSALLLDAMGEAVTQENIAKISPWRFETPLSPDMAAANEGRSVDFATLVMFCRDAIAAHTGPLLIEGVGGVMVPLDDRHTVLDWIEALDIPVLLVTGSYLGTISHTLTALHVLKRAGVQPSALIVNESEGSSVPLDKTVECLARFAAPVPTVPVSRSAGDFGAISGLLDR